MFILTDVVGRWVSGWVHLALRLVCYFLRFWTIGLAGGLFPVLMMIMMMMMLFKGRGGAEGNCSRAWEQRGRGRDINNARHVRTYLERLRCCKMEHCVCRIELIGSLRPFRDNRGLEMEKREGGEGKRREEKGRNGKLNSMLKWWKIFLSSASQEFSLR